MDEHLQVARTGIDEIDAQHRKLLADLERLEFWMQKGFGLAATFDALDALLSYAETHFRFEEDFLRAQAYPDVEKHAAQHRDFMGQIANLRRSLEAGEDVARSLADAMRAWIVGHINDEDVEYADYLRRGWPRGQA
ncbi:MAG: hemerythrin family protein [Rhodocyclaceae bacterium]|nr:hemerythrin family protein [Rhodocyclaceae bacterium]